MERTTSRYAPPVGCGLWEWGTRPWQPGRPASRASTVEEYTRLAVAGPQPPPIHLQQALFIDRRRHCARYSAAGRPPLPLGRSTRLLGFMVMPRCERLQLCRRTVRHCWPGVRTNPPCPDSAWIVQGGRPGRAAITAGLVIKRVRTGVYEKFLAQNCLSKEIVHPFGSHPGNGYKHTFWAHPNEPTS